MTAALLSLLAHAVAEHTSGTQTPTPSAALVRVVPDDEAEESKARKLCSGRERTPTRREWADLERRVRAWVTPDAPVRRGDARLIVRQPFGKAARPDPANHDEDLKQLRREADERNVQIDVVLISDAKMMTGKGKRFSVRVTRLTLFPHEAERRLTNLSEEFWLYRVTDDEPPRWLVMLSGSS